MHSQQQTRSSQKRSITSTPQCLHFTGPQPTGISRFPRRNVRTIYNVWIRRRQEHVTSLKSQISLIHCFNTRSHKFWRLSIFKETNRQIDTDRPTGRWAERQTGKETCRQAGRQRCRRLERQTSRGTGRRSGGQIGSSETGSHRQTSLETDTNSQADTDIDHEPAYTPLPRGILPHGNF